MSDAIKDDDFKMDSPIKRYGPMMIAIAVAFYCPFEPNAR